MKKPTRSTPKPIPVAPDVYWRVKAATMQHEVAMMKLQSMANQADAVYHEVLRGAGLDPTARYRLDDKTLTFVPMPSQEKPRAD